ncbi:unnamed protein product [Protopolystoma xenopodis]|uniref:Uncharacterized protein n=1 Tax=Protopolystoma xenopodis TaxID=117903 RepID=A0A3S5AUL4_9PLAT|nr:unnamed protein product [Protopolystoma xenopodis]
MNPSQLCEIICDKEFLRSLITPDSSSAPSKAESAFIREGGTESFQQGVDLACQSETGMLSNSESDHKWQSSLVTSNDYQECVTGVTFGNREEPSKVSLTAKEEAVLYGEKDLEQDSPHSDEHAAMGNADRVHNTDQI